MNKFVKMCISHDNKIVMEVTEEYKQTDKLIKDAKFVDHRFGDRYTNKQVRISELNKFIPGWQGEPQSGHVYCFEEDVEAAKVTLVESVNRRVQDMIHDVVSRVDRYNSRVEGIPGVATVNLSITMEVDKNG